jgi:hypothetical protein
MIPPCTTLDHTVICDASRSGTGVLRGEVAGIGRMTDALGGRLSRKRSDTFLGQA